MLVDTIFTNARVFNVFLKRWQTTDIAVLSGKILYIGNTETAGLTSKETVNCGRKPLIPGLIDIHLHIESSLCTPCTFASAVLPHGVTTVVSEPHEIANVFGLKGIEEMIRVSKGAAIDIFYGVPSSVPSTKRELETTGGVIGTAELETLLRRYPEVVCLGEVMNYSSMIHNFTGLVEKKIHSRTLNMIDYIKDTYPLTAIEGHCPSVRNLDLAKLLYLGIDSDHCLQDLEGMHQRLANGMFVEIQEKSVTQEIITYLQEHDVDGRYSFVTDDVPPDILQERGHLDYIVRKAMEKGLSLEKVITATSLAPAERMGFRNRGIIAPGKLADFILLRDESPDFVIEDVYKKGIKYTAPARTSAARSFNHSFYDSFSLPEQFTIDEMFTISVNKKFEAQKKVKCHVIRKNNRDTYTTCAVKSIEVINKTIDWESPRSDVNLVLVIDRYSGKAQTAQGLLDGIRIHKGAFCSSYAHDHHNILLAGDNITDMKKAFHWVVTERGGMCTVSSGKILSSVRLSIGGILSEAPMDVLSKDVLSVQQSLRQLGIDHANPIMSMCTLTLPVSPELKITDKGLIDVRQSKRVPLIIE